MKVTDLLLGLLFFLVLGTLIPVGLAYLAEWYTRKALQSYARFQSACQTLARFEKDLGDAAMEWPIYVRPVLFTSVDKSTQRTFGMAQRALTEAQGIAQTFPLVPARPAEAWQVFSPFKCVERIAYCDALIQREIEFAQWLGQVEEEKKALKRHRSEEKRTLENVRGKLDTLQKRLSAAKEKMALKAHGEVFNETVGWVINYAQIGTQASAERLDAHLDKGLLNYAIADTFIRLTNYLLDHFDLSATDVSFSEKFILDRFENHLKDFEINLRDVIESKTKAGEGSPVKEIPSVAVVQAPLSEIGPRLATQTMLTTRQATYQQTTNAIDTWEEVKKLDTNLDVLKRKLLRASSSLSIFLKVHTVYLDLNKKIIVPNIPRLQEDSLKLEADCEKYWGAFALFSIHWKEGLRGSKLPHVEFDEAREIFVNKIAHHLKPEVKVKQSEMPLIISKMNYFWMKVQSGQRSFKNLSAHLKLHKDSEVIALSRLADKGSTGKQVRKMESIKEDYSRPNQETCVTYRGEYDGFVGRAGKVLGANFPAMLEELDVFEEKCQDLIDKHKEEIMALHQQCGNNALALRTDRTKLGQFKGYVPRIKYNFQAMDARILSVLQKDYNNNHNYQWLQDYLKEIKEVVDNAKQAVSELNTQWKTFTDLEKEASRLVTQHQTTLVNYQKEFSLGWEWVKKEAAGLAEKTLKDVEKISAPLSKNRDPQYNLSIDDAKKNCQKVIRDIEAATSSSLGKLSLTRQQQSEYSQRYNALIDLIDKPIPQLNAIFQSKPNIPKRLRYYCVWATQMTDGRQVGMVLDKAERYLVDHLTEEEAAIINNYYSSVSITNSQIQGNNIKIAGNTIQGD